MRTYFFKIAGNMWLSSPMTKEDGAKLIAHMMNKFPTFTIVETESGLFGFIHLKFKFKDDADTAAFLLFYYTDGLELSRENDKI